MPTIDNNTDNYTELCAVLIIQIDLGWANNKELAYNNLYMAVVHRARLQSYGWIVIGGSGG